MVFLVRGSIIACTLLYSEGQARLAKFRNEPLLEYFPDHPRHTESGKATYSDDSKRDLLPSKIQLSNNFTQKKKPASLSTQKSLPESKQHKSTHNSPEIDSKHSKNIKIGQTKSTGKRSPPSQSLLHMHSYSRELERRAVRVQKLGGVEAIYAGQKDPMLELAQASGGAPSPISSMNHKYRNGLTSGWA